MSLQQYNERQIRIIQLMALIRHISTERMAQLYVQEGHAARFAQLHRRAA